MRDDVFVNKIIDIVDPKRELSAPDLVKLVEEKFTSTKKVISPCCAYCRDVEICMEACDMVNRKTCFVQRTAQ